jgi:hypothetical protein
MYAFVIHVLDQASEKCIEKFFLLKVKSVLDTDGTVKLQCETYATFQIKRKQILLLTNTLFFLNEISDGSGGKMNVHFSNMMVTKREVMNISLYSSQAKSCIGTQQVQLHQQAWPSQSKQL